MNNLNYYIIFILNALDLRYRYILSLRKESSDLNYNN